ncbi:MAG: NAD-binding protein, partial [Bryobacteraceae bacterium]
VFVLVLLPVVFGAARGSGNLPVAAALAAAKLAIFIALTLGVGGRVVPWFLNKVAETRSRELFTLSVLALALGIAAGSAYLFGVSMALGAFLAGMVVGQTDFSARAGADALPMRDAFAVMFFLSVGMLFDPGETLASPAPLLATLSVVMIGKPVAALLVVSALGYSSKIGFRVALALAQIGEFSFLLATLGIQVGALPPGAMNPLVAAAIISIMLNTLLYRRAATLEDFVRRRGWLWRALNRKAVAVPDQPVAGGAPSHRAVVVGYGPIGQVICRILRQREIEPTVIEMNIETMRRLRSEGVPAVYGDANQMEVLEKAGVARAASIILSASGSIAAVAALRLAREMNPGIHVVARADFLREARLFREAGADEVFSGEGEVALAIADSILRHLGATPEQLDEARERIRAQVLGAAG